MSGTSTWVTSPDTQRKACKFSTDGEKKAGRAGCMNCPGGADRGHKAQAEEPYLFNTVPLKISIGPLVKLL